jgi:hypothetical protein
VDPKQFDSLLAAMVAAWTMRIKGWRDAIAYQVLTTDEQGRKVPRWAVRADSMSHYLRADGGVR